MNAFVFDALVVVGKFLWVVLAHIYDGGFERREFYVLRGDRRVLAVWRTGDGPPPKMPQRLKPWKIVLPGWSAYTRLPHIREYEAHFKWL